MIRTFYFCITIYQDWNFMKQKFTIFLFALSFIYNTQAQDPQFSQFYSAPLYINPALAGSGGNARAIMNYRNQWPNLSESFVTYSLSFDYYFEKFRGGIGGIYTNDLATTAGFRSQNFGLQFSYDLTLNNEYNLRVGTQLGYTSRDINFFDLTFGQQYDDTGFIGGASGEPTPETVLQYLDVAAGAFVYNEKYWLGLSVHNMTRPDQTFVFGSSAARLPVRYTLQAGAKFPLIRGENYRDKYRAGYKERSIVPTLLYKHQGSSDQLDIGAYVNYSPLVFGLWYRGIPLKNYDIGISNNEALVVLLGCNVGTLNIGYSYDFTISALGPASGGAHELSLRYTLVPQIKKGVKKKYKPLPLPNY